MDMPKPRLQMAGNDGRVGVIGALRAPWGFDGKIDPLIEPFPNGTLAGLYVRAVRGIVKQITQAILRLLFRAPKGDPLLNPLRLARFRIARIAELENQRPGSGRPLLEGAAHRSGSLLYSSQGQIWECEYIAQSDAMGSRRDGEV